MKVRPIRPNIVTIMVVAGVIAAAGVIALAGVATARGAAPANVKPAAAKLKLIGTWDATPTLDEINLMAMDLVQDPDLARARAIGQRLIYTFGPKAAMRIAILSRPGPDNDAIIDALEPQVVDATWDVATGPKGLVLKITPTKGGKALEQPLTFKDDDAFFVESDLLEHEGFLSPYHFRRNIGDRVTRWLKANNSVGGEKAPLVADLSKGVAPYVARGEDFRIRIGGGLTKSGKPTEVFAFCEQLFVREMTDAEAAKTKLARTGATTAHWPRKDVFPILSEATIASGPKFDAGGGRMDLRKPITGTVTYAETNRLPPDAMYVVRVSMVIGEKMVSAYHRSVSPRPGASTWKFSVDPPKDLADYAGPVHVFVDLCRETKFKHSDVTMQVMSPSADAHFEAGK
jgi:hypothetical protein